MFKHVQLSEENIELLKKYGDSPNKAITSLLQGVPEIRGDTMIGPGCGPQPAIPSPVILDESVITKIISAIEKRMDRYESGQRVINADLLARLSSLGGHSVPQEGADAYGFRRASSKVDSK